MVRKLLLTIFIIFTFVGFFLIGQYWLRDGSILVPTKNEQKTTAIITDIRQEITEHDVYVKYEVNGKTYDEKLNASSYSVDYEKGKKIDIVYDKTNPKKIAAPWLRRKMFIKYGIPGGTLFIAGLIGVFCMRKKTGTGKRLKEKGKLVYADFKGIEENEDMTINGKRPNRVVCDWEDPKTGKIYIFKSEYLFNDQEEKLKGKVFEQVPVYIDVTNKENYYVDVSGLLGE